VQIALLATMESKTKVSSGWTVADRAHLRAVHVSAPQPADLLVSRWDMLVVAHGRIQRTPSATSWTQSTVLR